MITGHSVSTHRDLVRNIRGRLGDVALTVGHKERNREDACSGKGKTDETGCGHVVLSELRVVTALRITGVMNNMFAYICVATMGVLQKCTG